LKSKKFWILPCYFWSLNFEFWLFLVYSPSINNLIRQLKKLPSVGVHTAERFVFYWLRSGKKTWPNSCSRLKNWLRM
jgi:hypothetical protein